MEKTSLEKAFEGDKKWQERVRPVDSKTNQKILETVITDIVTGKRTKEDYSEVLSNIKKDKKLKNYLVDTVVEKVFGKGKLSFLIKMAAKVYLSTKFGI